jgi:16S rRNA (cytidine1402-2'-O)-methyltransferase
LAAESRTIIFYESPYRLVKTLSQLAEFLGEEREAAVSREISKFHEENRRGTLIELANWYSANEPKGEIVIVVSAKRKESRQQEEE